MKNVVLFCFVKHLNPSPLFVLLVLSCFVLSCFVFSLFCWVCFRLLIGLFYVCVFLFCFVCFCPFFLCFCLVLFLFCYCFCFLFFSFEKTPSENHSSQVNAKRSLLNLQPFIGCIYQDRTVSGHVVVY